MYAFIDIWNSQSGLSDKRKQDLFQVALAYILLHRCTIWTVSKRIE